jgi:RHS repeat-associated protein
MKKWLFKINLPFTKIPAKLFIISSLTILLCNVGLGEILGANQKFLNSQLQTTQLQTQTPFSSLLKVIPQSQLGIERGTVNISGTNNINSANNSYAVGSLPGKFKVSAKGAAIYNIAISVPPGTNDITPEIAINYNSQQQNGLLGMGFSLSGLTAITRTGQNIAQNGKTHGVDFTSEDRFSLDGDQLVATTGKYGADGTEYHTYEASFAKIVSYGQKGNGPEKFKVWTKGGETAEYGFTPDSQVEASGKETIAQWTLNKIEDRAGNYLTVKYYEDITNGIHYPEEINYTGNAKAGLSPYNQVKFIYEDRPDVEVHYRAGSKVTLNKRLKEIQTYAEGKLVFAYKLQYEQSPNTGRSRLTSIQECNAQGECLTPTTFVWQTNAEGWENAPQYTPPEPIVDADYKDGGVRFVDLTGNGIDEMVYSIPGTTKRWLNTGNGWQSSYDYHIPWSFTSHLYGPRDFGVRFADLNGNGVNDILIANNDGYDNLYSKAYLNTGQDFQPDTSYALPASLLGTYKYCQDVGGRILDLNNNGLPDFVKNQQDVFSDAWLNTGTTWQENAAFKLPISVINKDYQDIGTRFVDLNGNNLPDLVQNDGQTNNAFLNNGSGWNQASEFLLPTEIVNSEHKDAGARFVDLNNDGLADLVKHKDGGINNAWMNTGAGWIANSDFIIPVPVVYGDNSDAGTRFVDLNGNGYPDLVINNGKDPAAAWLNTGLNWKKNDNYAIPVTIAKDGKNYGLRFVDLTGNGIKDIVYRNKDTQGALINKATKSPDFLISVTDGLGEKIDIDYEPLTSFTKDVYSKDHDGKYPNVDIKNPIYVVYQTSSDTDSTSANTNTDANNNHKNNKKNGQHITQYHYTGAKLNRLGWGFLGFRQIKKTDLTTGISKTTTYSQNPNDQIIEKILTEEIRTKENILLSSTENHWTVVPQATIDSNNAENNTKNSTYYYIYTDKITKKHYSLKGELISTQVINTTMDKYGNPVDVLDTIADPNNTYTTHTINTYENYSDTWILGNLTEATVTCIETNNKNEKDKNSNSRTSSFIYNTNGVLSQTITEPNDLDYSVTKDITRDDFGNIVATTITGKDIATRTTKLQYDDKGRFVIQETNPLKQTTYQITDPRFGTITQTTDLNGFKTTYEYDNFGRLYKKTDPDGTTTTTTYNWCNPKKIYGIQNTAQKNDLQFAVYYKMMQTSGGNTQTAYYDQLNREVANNHYNVDGSLIWQTKQYDELDRVVAQSIPYKDGEQPLYTQIQHDVLGRITQLIEPDGGVVATTYDGFTSTITNQLGQTSTHIKDARGKLIKAIDHSGNATNYKYDSYGHLLEITDCKGNKTIMIYDKLGRKIAIDDPDKGNWTYSYDVLGELVSQTDAKKQITTLQYDVLGRLIARTDIAGTSTWEYGNDINKHNVGKLVTVTGVANFSRDKNGKVKITKANGRQLINAAKENLVNYTRNYTYDELSRPNTITTNINKTVYQEQISYDDHSRPEIITYPNKFKVKKIYNNLGFLIQTISPDTQYSYWQLLSMTSRGQIESFSNGSGVITKYSYDNTNGNLLRIKTASNTALKIQQQMQNKSSTSNTVTQQVKQQEQDNKSSNEVIQDITYGYDKLGEMLLRSDYAIATSDTFTYDNLNRITNWKRNGTEQAIYQYDAIGNITQKSNVTGGYYYYNTNKPHAVSLITDGTGTAKITLSYDANGNMNTADYSGKGKRIITYSSFDKPSSIVEGTTTTNFYYNADRSRFIREDQSDGKKDTTLYLDNFELVIHDNGDNQTIEQKCYIAPNALLIENTDAKGNSTNKLYYLYTDNLGSVTAITDANATILQRFDYTPFGNQTQTKGKKNILTNQGFSGHEEIENFKLIHMNGRLYDPVLGRFLSADPIIQSPENSQSLNRYSYCLNNPLIFTDSSGYFLDDFFDFIGDIFSSIGDAISSLFTEEFFINAIGIAIGVLAMSNPVTAALGLQGFGWACSAFATSAYQGAIAMINGGDIGDVLKYAAINFAVASAWAGTGGFLESVESGVESGNWGTRSLVHGLVGGGLEEAQGGHFADGFIAAATGEAVSMHFPLSADGLTLKTIASRTATAAIVGGTATAIIGGDFANGAKTAAYAQLYNDFNDLMHDVVTGATVGAVIGATTGGEGGAAVGTVAVPGLGTVAGAAGGSLVGSIVGAIGGMAKALITDVTTMFKVSSSTKEISNKTGISEKEVKQRIHRAKPRIPKSTLVKNPDVAIDTETGEIYPKIRGGKLGDSIGNIYDE